MTYKEKRQIGLCEETIGNVRAGSHAKVQRRKGPPVGFALTILGKAWYTSFPMMHYI